MILVNGRLHAPRHPGATALVVRGPTISYVGDDDGARAHALDDAEIDLAGGLCTPAFVDAHLHAVQTGQVMSGLDLHGVASRTELLDRVSAYAAANPGVRVIVGQGWDERAWPDPTPPTRFELDRAARGMAVYLARVDVHSAVVSSALLALLPDVSQAEGFSAEGPLSREAHHLCRGKMDRLFSDAERRSAARAALSRAAQLGVATVHELGGPHLGPIEDLRRVRDVGAELGLAVVTYWGELASDEAVVLAREFGAAGLAGDLCIDGAIGSRTAALCAPYADGGGYGARYLSEDQITTHLVRCTELGLQAGFHCIGDDAVAAAVQGLRRAAVELGDARVIAARHRLEHVEMLAAADFAVLARLGVTASVQPGFDAEWGGHGELYEQRLGAQRSATMNPFGSMHRAGVRLALGTDAPVTPLAGWATVRHAVRHSRAAERLDVPTAFAAATVGAHRAGLTDDAGTIATGMRADLAVWDVVADLIEPATGLPRLDPADPLPGCRLTLGAGRIAFRADGGGSG